MTSIFKGETVPDHIEGIMVHCLGTTREWSEARDAAFMVKEVRRWHVQDRGWSDIGYAAICDRLGNAAKGRDLDGDGFILDEQWAAARGWNRTYIHLALAGGYGSDEDDAFGSHYTHLQDAWLRDAVQEIADLAGRPLWLKGHNEVAAKACPGFNVARWYGASTVEPQPKPLNPVAAFIGSLTNWLGEKS